MIYLTRSVRDNKAILATIMVLACYATSPAAAQEAEWGHIKGRIVWGPQGAPDAPRKADVAFVINGRNRGLRDTVVWLINDDPKNKAALPIHPTLLKVKQEVVKIEVASTAFVPQVVAMRQGPDLTITNSTSVVQNVKWTGGVNFGGALLPSGAHVKIAGLVAERLPMHVESQNMVSSMNGRIAVFAHPYFAVTGADGAFEIKNAPAGKYRIVVWNNAYHDGAKGRFGQPITIRADNTLELGDIAFFPVK
jgi:hypothetical protein